MIPIAGDPEPGCPKASCPRRPHVKGLSGGPSPFPGGKKHRSRAAGSCQRQFISSALAPPVASLRIQAHRRSVKPVHSCVRQPRPPSSTPSITIANPPRIRISLVESAPEPWQSTKPTDTHKPSIHAFAREPRHRQGPQPSELAHVAHAPSPSRELIEPTRAYQTAHKSLSPTSLRRRIYNAHSNQEPIVFAVHSQPPRESDSHHHNSFHQARRSLGSLAIAVSAAQALRSTSSLALQSWAS